MMGDKGLASRAVQPVHKASRHPVKLCQAGDREAIVLGPSRRLVANMEETKTTGVEASTETPQYQEDVKAQPQETPTSKPSSLKEKDAIYAEALAADSDLEGQEKEIHLDTAADLVTQVIDLDDDPSLNPWTFRMFFIGSCRCPRCTASTASAASTVTFSNTM